MIDKKISIPAIVSLGYLILVFFGSLRLYFLYYGIGINIFNYLEISEILTSFLKSIIFIFFIFFYIYFTVFFLYVRTQKKGILKFLTIEISAFNLGAIMAVFIFGIWYGLYALKVKYNNGIIIGSFFFSIIAILTLLFFSKSRFFTENLKILKDLNIVKTSLILLICTLFIVAISFIEKGLIFTYKNKGSTIVFKDNSTLISSDTMFYFNQTKNYIFFFSDQTNVCKVIPVSEVKEVNIKK